MVRAVLFKLVLFAVMMAVVPIGTYFTTLKFFTKGECILLIGQEGSGISSSETVMGSELS